MDDVFLLQANIKLMADGPSFSYEKLGTRNLYTSRIQVSRTRNVADDRDDKEFYILFFPDSNL